MSDKKPTQNSISGVPARKPGILSGMGGLVRRGLGLANDQPAKPAISVIETGRPSSDTSDPLVSLLEDLRHAYPEWGWTRQSDEGGKIVGKLGNGELITLYRSTFNWPDNETATRTDLFAQAKQLIDSHLNLVSGLDISWDAAKSRLMPYLMPELDEVLLAQRLGFDDEMRANSATVWRRFDPELNLCIYLAIDGEKSIGKAKIRQLRDWNVSEDDAFDVAFQNLLQHTDSTVFSPLGPPGQKPQGWCIPVRDGYAVSRFLLAPVRKHLCELLDSQVCFVGIPNRDFLVAWSDENLMGGYLKQISHDSQAMDHPVSGRIFVVRSDGAYKLVPNIEESTSPHISSEVEINQTRAMSLFQQGVKHVSDGQLELAIETLTEALHLVPDKGEIVAERSVAYARSDRWDEAISDIDEANRLLPNVPFIMSTRAEYYLHENRFEEAILDLEILAARLPAVEAPHELLSSAYKARASAALQNRRYQDAVDDFSTALKWKPTSAELYRGRAASNSLLNNHDATIADCNAGLSLDVMDGLLWTLRGDASRQLGKYGDAISDLRHASQLQPDSALIIMKLGDALSDNDAVSSEALAAYARAVQLQPENADGWAKRGIVYYHRRAYELAVADFSAALELSPDHTKARSARAHAYLALGNARQAEADISDILRVDPNNVSVRYQLVQLLQTQRNHTAALQQLARLVESSPYTTIFWETRGEEYYVLGRYVEALADFEQAVTLYSQEISTLSGEKISSEELSGAYNGRAWTRIRVGRDMPAAIADATKGILGFSTSRQGSAYQTRAVAYFMNAEYTKALNDIDKALSIEPESALNLYTRSVIKSKMGDIQGANGDLVAAGKINPNIATDKDVEFLLHPRLCARV